MSADQIKGAPGLEFRDVRLDYGTGLGLHGLTFAAPARGLTALVGPSGAGKSSALKCAARLWAHTAGQVRVHGAAASAYRLTDLRSRVIYLDQSYTLVAGSIRTNLTLGGPDVSEELLYEVLDRVGLAEHVAALAEGLDTVIGSGIDFSGGQRQRVALARTLLSPADVVLLDEPTSALDGHNEALLRDIVAELAQTRCVVVAAHRMSTVREADQVVVVESGRCVESGAPDELATRSSRFTAMLDSQRVPVGVRA